MNWNPEDYLDPTRFPAPLEPNDEGLPTHSDGYKLVALVERYWILPDGSPLVLDEWQKRLIIRVLETDALGNLRFRQVLISVARQNGKSVLGGVFALYGLIQMMQGATVVGIASSVEQANIIFKRVGDVLSSHKALRERFNVTRFRGIRSKVSSATYDLKPAKPGAIQGIPVNLGLVDELHLEQSGQCWDDIVNGQRAQKVALVIGITTAGDSSSKTLKRLYESQDGDTYGKFIYEGVEGAPVDDVESILRANPSIACGRIDLETVLADVRSQPEHTVRRYLHNLFVDSANPFVSPSDWLACRGEGITKRENVVIGVDVTSRWRYATIVASVKNGDTVETQIVQSFNSPSLEALTEALDAIHQPGFQYAMDNNLRDVQDFLRDKGRTVHNMGHGGYQRSTEMLYSLIAEKRLNWRGSDSLLNHQVSFAKTKQVAGQTVLDKKDDVDAIRAMAFSTYVANAKPRREVNFY